jgi:hypothetical protein
LLKGSLHHHTYLSAEQYRPAHEERGLSYKYTSSWERFWETTLPPTEAFYSQPTGEGINEVEYQYASKVWETFGCQNLGDYHDLDLKTDVLLLADVFENFRKTCQGQYGLDPAHYSTSPGLSWDALLKKTGVELELQRTMTVKS